MSVSTRIINGRLCACCGGKKAEGRSKCLACTGDPVRLAHHQEKRRAMGEKWGWCWRCLSDAPDHDPTCLDAQPRNPDDAQQEHDALQAAGLRSGSRFIDAYEFDEFGDRYTGGER